MILSWAATAKSRHYLPTPCPIQLRREPARLRLPAALRLCKGTLGTGPPTGYRCAVNAAAVLGNHCSNAIVGLTPNDPSPLAKAVPVIRRRNPKGWGCSSSLPIGDHTGRPQSQAVTRPPRGRPAQPRSPRNPAYCGSRSLPRHKPERWRRSSHRPPGSSGPPLPGRRGFRHTAPHRHCRSAEFGQ